MLNAWIIYETVGDKDWFNEETGEVLVDIRAGVIACKAMHQEAQEKHSKHDNIMEEARRNPDAALKRARSQGI